MPITITAAANGRESHEVQPLAVAVGTGVTAAGSLAVSEDELAAAAGEAASRAGVLTASDDELVVTGAVVVAAACVADRFAGLAASRAA